MEQGVVRKILPASADFREFWKERGPFRYALTSREFPPVLLEPEEWLFASDITALLKELMQWKTRKIKLVQAPFNKKKTDVLKPDMLVPWRINNFPEEWEPALCSSFTPKGYLTDAVLSMARSEKKEDIEEAFFQSLAQDINGMGYCLFQPEPARNRGDHAFVDDYLKEWEEDERL
ncbi:MAG TPA: hypothetical protein VJ936_00525 [Desulfobacteraceae bacterium]|nr:hypothetical protein [Desulfobacteraceae bacterium]